MKKAIIIDDEPLARLLVREYLTAHPDIEVVAECGDGFEGLKKINELHPELIFLDVQMPKINGFELLELLSTPVRVIFTTAFDEYALKAFESNAVDYLLKPFSQERFSQAVSKLKHTESEQHLDQLQHVLHKQPDESLRIVVKDGNEICIIPTSEVHYVEAYDDYVKIYTKEGYHLKKKTLSYYESTLNPTDFIRIHRSYLLNISYLTKIESFEKNSYVAVLSSGKRIPISRTAYPILKQHLGI